MSENKNVASSVRHLAQDRDTPGNIIVSLGFSERGFAVQTWFGFDRVDFDWVLYPDLHEQ
ncbi:hypothetical protein N7507_009448 [Penicillium longicatenatum]|nr:hypothetical protein N7507_009448 [Penicillium longicatenatum]